MTRRLSVLTDGFRGGIGEGGGDTIYVGPALSSTVSIATLSGDVDGILSATLSTTGLTADSDQPILNANFADVVLLSGEAIWNE